VEAIALWVDRDPSYPSKADAIGIIDLTCSQLFGLRSQDWSGKSFLADWLVQPDCMVDTPQYSDTEYNWSRILYIQPSV
jgi:hypothetical protein